jgi:hypothetical protein
VVRAQAANQKTWQLVDDNRKIYVVVSAPTDPIDTTTPEEQDLQPNFNCFFQLSNNP